VTEMDVAGLSLQNSSFGTDEGVDLTGSTSLVSAGPVMRLHMTAAQLRSVQFQRNLCTAVSNCYLAVTNATVIDMVDEPVVAVASSGALQLGTFSDDWTEPVFVSFLAFNLSSAVLTISFSEPVAPESWSPTGVVLQTDSTVPLSTYTLTGGVVSTTNDQRIYDITLPADDTNAIKADSFVCTFRSVCYIRMANISVTDTSRNNYLVYAMVCLFPNPESRQRSICRFAFKVPFMDRQIRPAFLPPPSRMRPGSPREYQGFRIQHLVADIFFPLTFHSF